MCKVQEKCVKFRKAQKLRKLKINAKLEKSIEIAGPKKV